jgi:hypothetical protein
MVLMCLCADHHTYTGNPAKDTELLSSGDIAIGATTAAGAAFKAGFRKVPDSLTEYVMAYLRLDGYLKVTKALSWPRSWANFSLL